MTDWVRWSIVFQYQYMAQSIPLSFYSENDWSGLKNRNRNSCEVQLERWKQLCHVLVFADNFYYLLDPETLTRHQEFLYIDPDLYSVLCFYSSCVTNTCIFLNITIRNLILLSVLAILNLDDKISWWNFYLNILSQIVSSI